MTNAQLSSWADIKEHLQGRRKEVFDALMNRAMTLFELCSCLGWQINCVSGRVSELKKMGIVEVIGEKVNPQSNKKVSVFGVRQLELF